MIIVTAIKTDLPTGIVGELFDWSQDHSTPSRRPHFIVVRGTAHSPRAVMDHLHMIYNAAPDRVGVYGLVTQDHNKKRASLPFSGLLPPVRFLAAALDVRHSTTHHTLLSAADLCALQGDDRGRRAACHGEHQHGQHLLLLLLRARTPLFLLSRNCRVVR